MNMENEVVGVSWGYVKLVIMKNHENNFKSHKNFLNKSKTIGSNMIIFKKFVETTIKRQF